jgi:pimeloyl-ACP methyl ester carboxylesterase
MPAHVRLSAPHASRICTCGEVGAVSIPFCRTAALARGVGLEGAALAGHLALYPGGFAPERRPLPPRHCSHDATAGHSPVLLLHGLFDNRAVFTLLRHNLHIHGWDHLHGLNYNPLTLDVPRAAALLGRHVEHTRRVYGGERLAIVGHSLGGLIARYYVQLLGGSAHVHTLVTLGTPHQGTVVAHALRPLPIVRQMLPDSEVMAALAAPAPGCRTRFLCFWGDLDPLIVPHGNARLAHPDLTTENVLVRNAGHLTLPVHWEVLARIRAELNPAGPPVIDRQIA